MCLTVNVVVAQRKMCGTTLLTVGQCYGRFILHFAYGKVIARPSRDGFTVREIVESRSTFSRRDAFPVRKMKYESSFRLMLLWYSDDGCPL